MGRYKLSRILIIMFLSLVLVYLPASVAKALMIQLSLEELTEEADSVIIGTVLDSQSYWNNDRNSIYTTVTVTLDNHLKGNPLPDLVSVIVPGGKIDDVMQIVSDTPFFETGEEVLLFLEDLPQQIYPRTIFQLKTHSVFGNFQGKKEIINNKVDGIPVEDVEEIILQMITEEQAEKELSDNPAEPVLVSNHQYVPLGIRWPDSSPVISFRINAPEDYSNQVQAAAATWSSAGANFSFDYRGPHSRSGTASLNQVNEIMWADLGTTNALALATIWCSGTTIIEADMVMNTRFNWTTNPFSYHDVQTVALHEFGHWIGLNHSPDYNSIMYHQYKGTQRQLSPDDIAGINYIYGSSGTIQAPLNDNFADRLVLTGVSGEATGNNYYATRETGEPLHAGLVGGASVWWEWTAPEEGKVIIDAFGSSFDTVLAIYSGSSLQTLIEIASNDDADTIGTWQSRVEFTAVSGTIYLIAVDGWNGANGSIVLNWEQSPDSIDEPSEQDGDDEEGESEEEIDQADEEEIEDPNLEDENSDAEADAKESTSPSGDPAAENDPDLEVDSEQGDRQSEPDIITDEPPQSAPPPAQDEKIAGDLNGDDRIDINDVTIVARFALGLTLLTENQALAADINGDGTVDVRDTILLMRYVLGLIESLSATGS